MTALMYCNYVILYIMYSNGSVSSKERAKNNTCLSSKFHENLFSSLSNKVYCQTILITVYFGGFWCASTQYLLLIAESSMHNRLVYICHTTYRFLFIFTIFSMFYIVFPNIFDKMRQLFHAMDEKENKYMKNYSPKTGHIKEIHSTR